MPKVVIIGAGSVGTTLAYSLQITGVATELVLIDSNHELAEGQVAGEYPDCSRGKALGLNS